MKAKKRIPGQSIRNTWQINPRTRVHDNDIRRNKKKQRQLAQKELGDLMKTRPKGVVQNDLMDNPLAFIIYIYDFVSGVDHRSNSRFPISFR